MSDQSQFLLYTAPDGAVKVDVFFKDETVWLMAKGAGRTVRGQGACRQQAPEEYLRVRRTDRVFSYFHFGNNCRRWQKLPDTLLQPRCHRRRLPGEQLQATQFRIWATKTLREFIVKGFVLDDERLKQGKRVFGKDSRPAFWNCQITRFSRASNHELSSPQSCLQRPQAYEREGRPVLLVIVVKRKIPLMRTRMQGGVGAGAAMTPPTRLAVFGRDRQKQYNAIVNHAHTSRHAAQ